jgi:acetylglutamate kinase
MEAAKLPAPLPLEPVATTGRLHLGALLIRDGLLTAPQLEAALAEGLIPVVAPLAEGPLNVNADDTAAALAVGLGADRVLFLTDVPGVLLEEAVVPELAAGDAERLLGAGTFADGIVPKLQAAVRAARGGVAAEIGATAVTP